MIIISILQMKRLRHREVLPLARSHTANLGVSAPPSEALCSPGPPLPLPPRGPLVEFPRLSVSTLVLLFQ